MTRGYRIAAEGQQRTPGGGIAGGMGSVTPAGVLHAVDPATGEAMCGQPMRRLVAFKDLQWTTLRGGIRCRACAGALPPG